MPGTFWTTSEIRLPRLGSRTRPRPIVVRDVQACPGVIAVWQRVWDQFVPFLQFPPEIRRVIYTTNQIESINYQLRKVTKNRGHFPNDDAAVKLLYLALRNINPERGGDLATGTYAWKQALNAFAINSPDGYHCDNANLSRAKTPRWP